jgi:anti-sigma factor ChrR (cupin superfamily)
MGQAPQMSGIPTSMMSQIPSIQNHNVPSTYQHSPAPPSSGPTVLLVANLDEQVIFLETTKRLTQISAYYM